MSQAENQDTTMPPGADAASVAILDAQDVLSARLSQMEGVLSATMNCWDDREFALPDHHMLNVIWTVQVLRDQAADAYQALVDGLAVKAGV